MIANTSRHLPRSDRRRDGSNRAFTLLEVLVCVSIIAVVAFATIPMMTDDSRLRLSAAADILESDIEFAQVLVMADPANPVVLRIDPDEQAWWIAPVHDPDRPILRTDGTPYVAAPGYGRARSAAGVTFTVNDLHDERDLLFNAMGGLTDLTRSPTILLSAGGHTIGMRIAPHTGRVTQFSPTGTDVVEVKPLSADPIAPGGKK